MSDNTNNKEFWNSYVEYWEERIKQANGNEKCTDKTPDDRILETYFQKLQVSKEDMVLDYGCGSGRLYPIYKDNIGNDYNNYLGIDISNVCLEHAQNKYLELKINKNLYEFDGIHIPLGDGSVERIICYGVFDSCQQERTIRELLRVLKTEGLLLITGKNNNYYSDDDAAKIAEENARKKEHPNYFTDTQYMMKQLKENGVSIEESFYFLKRGDFSENKYVNEIPHNFYEWVLLLKKTQAYIDAEYDTFSDKYSLISKNA